MAQLPHYDCLSCGHKWIPRRDTPPKICPKCKSDKWDLGENQIIYFIQAGEDGAIKIGLTSNILTRIISFRTHQEKALFIRRLVPGNLMREREIAQKFDHLRIRGEWFSPGPDLVEYINSLEDENISLEDADTENGLRVKYGGRADATREFRFFLPKEIYPIFEQMAKEAEQSPAYLARHIIADYIEQKTGRKMPRWWDRDHS